MILLLILFITLIFFRLAIVLHRFIGDTGTSIVKRIMGLLLAAVAVEKVLSGIADFYKGVSDNISFSETAIQFVGVGELITTGISRAFTGW